MALSSYLVFKTARVAHVRAPGLALLRYVMMLVLMFYIGKAAKRQIGLKHRDRASSRAHCARCTYMERLASHPNTSELRVLFLCSVASSSLPPHPLFTTPNPSPPYVSTPLLRLSTVSDHLQGGIPGAHGRHRGLQHQGQRSHDGSGSFGLHGTGDACMCVVALPQHTIPSLSLLCLCFSSVLSPSIPFFPPLTARGDL